MRQAAYGDFPPFNCRQRFDISAGGTVEDEQGAVATNHQAIVYRVSRRSGDALDPGVGPFQDSLRRDVPVSFAVEHGDSIENGEIVFAMNFIDADLVIPIEPGPQYLCVRSVDGSDGRLLTVGDTPEHQDGLG